jgi:predicted metal-binding membrane protein
VKESVARTGLEKFLRRDRWLLVAGLGLVVLLSWGWLLAGAGMSLDGVTMTRMSLGADRFMEMDAIRPESWTAGYVLVMFSMWWIMMAAMMLPSATPVILLAAAVNRRAEAAAPPFGAPAAFAAGYLGGWGAFSALAVGAQYWLARQGLLADMLVIRDGWLAAGLLIAAGAWQFTPLKRSCLRHCRSPLDFLVRHRRAGNGGAVRMGLAHGLYCLGCCWFLMLLLFVGGVMNLLWVGAIALYVWLEKGLPSAHRWPRLAGLAMIGGGCVVALGAWP